MRLSLLALALPIFAATARGAADKVDFNYDIRPIISSKCFHCHGPDEKARKAKLRLDLREEAIAERDGIRAIVPGDPEASDAMVRILSKDKDEVMPPPKEGHAITANEAALVRRWIEQGAEYKPHWAFQKPVRPAVPALPSPNADLGNPIDAFIRARLAKSSLTPSPEADPATLIRRVSLDLTGLPPTPEEVRAFVAETRSSRREETPTSAKSDQNLVAPAATSHDSPTAYERLVDRLLASPAFGERWAKMWLDLARYADSTGYGSDAFRLNIWPYRDWVIDAFNRNLPFDQFTIEQLAGDLLPNATPEQIAATAFHRNTMTNTEGGTIDEEWRVAAVKDRIATTGQVWMGLTVGCAQCHTHKFDPISQKEYYQLFAVFNQTEDSDRGDEEPTLPLPSAEQRAQQDKLRAEIAALEQRLRGTSPEMEAEQHEWEAQMARTIEWQVLAPIEARADSEVKLVPQPDGSLLATGFEAGTDTYTVKVKALRHATAVRLEVLPDDSLPGHGPGRSGNGNAVVSDLKLGTAPEQPQAGARGRFVRVELPGKRKMLSLAEVQVFKGGYNLATKGTATQSSTDFEGLPQLAIDGKTDGEFTHRSVTHTRDEKNPWWEVDLGAPQDIDAIFVWNRMDAGVEDRLSQFKVSILDEARNPVWTTDVATVPRPSARLAVPGSRELPLANASADFSQPEFEAPRAIDGDGKTGWAFAPQLGQPHAAVFELKEPAIVRPGDLFVFTIRQSHGQKHTLGRFRLSATTAERPVRELPASIRATLAIEPTERTPEQRAALLDYFRPLSTQFAKLTREIEAKKADLAKIKPVQLPIMRELAAGQQRDNFVMIKGNYLARGEPVQPALFSTFAAAIPKDQPMNRLAAARWLVSPENPLTARVTVNRFWARLFGIGLVETEEDFGTQGALPSHPDLLDWLAVTFESPLGNDAAAPALGWNVKALLRLIVTSATYKQSSKVSAEAAQEDPRDRLLSHYPRRRLDAETVRDQALAVSGLLSRKIGGPSVYPPQPPGLWNVAFNGGQNTYPTSTGEDRYRRGLYTFWRRTMPNPSMTTFDAPSRETCTIRRVPTNTPLQAFVTLNDPAFVEAAQALARRMVKEGGADTSARLAYGLRLVLAREPEPAQITALQQLLDTELAHYRSAPEDARKLATDPLGPLPADADAGEFAAYTVIANVLLNLDGVLSKS